MGVSVVQLLEREVCEGVCWGPCGSVAKQVAACMLAGLDATFHRQLPQQGGCCAAQSHLRASHGVLTCIHSCHDPATPPATGATNFGACRCGAFSMAWCTHSDNLAGLWHTLAAGFFIRG